MKIVHINKEKTDRDKAIDALADQLTQKWNRENKEKAENKKGKEKANKEQK